MGVKLPVHRLHSQAAIVHWAASTLFIHLQLLIIGLHLIGLDISQTSNKEIGEYLISQNNKNDPQVTKHSIHISVISRKLISTHLSRFIADVITTDLLRVRLFPANASLS